MRLQIRVRLLSPVRGLGFARVRVRSHGIEFVRVLVRARV